MVMISVWYIVTDSYDSMTFMDLETRGVISSMSSIMQYFIYFIILDKS